MKSIRLAVIAALLAPCATQAEVRQAAVDGFFVASSVTVAATPAKAYAAVVAVPAWWSDEHTWSGRAANLSLKAEAGGCFCERWSGGSAEHGRVLMALPGNLLRLDAALGPLQELALKGILSFWIRDGDDGATRIDVEYRVNGSETSGLDALAPQVDEMLAAQAERLKRYIDTGKPDAPVAAETAADPRPDAARAALLEQWKHEAEAAKAGEAKTGTGKPAKPKPAKREPVPTP